MNRLAPALAPSPSPRCSPRRRGWPRGQVDLSFGTAMLVARRPRAAGRAPARPRPRRRRDRVGRGHRRDRREGRDRRDQAQRQRARQAPRRRPGHAAPEGQRARRRRVPRPAGERRRLARRRRGPLLPRRGAGPARHAALGRRVLLAHARRPRRPRRGGSTSAPSPSLLGLASPAQAPGHARRAWPRGHARAARPHAGARPAARRPADARRPRRSASSARPTSLRLRGWVESRSPPDQRSAELRYAHGRHLFLSREYSAAFAELDALMPAISRSTRRRRRPLAPARHVHRRRVGGGARPARPGDRPLRQDRRPPACAPPTTRDPRPRLARPRPPPLRPGRPAEALRAYRQVGRDSPLFAEAMYETAWALLRAGRHEVALAALDVVLTHDPDGPVAPEALQLRGKLHVQQKSWKVRREAEFTSPPPRVRGQAPRASPPPSASRPTPPPTTPRSPAAEGPEFHLGALLPRGALVFARTHAPRQPGRAPGP
jgi:hypothetical protein